MPLTTTIEQIAPYVPIAFFTNETELPNMALYEEDYIVPAIGRTAYDALIANQGNPNYQYQFIITAARRAIASLGYYHELPKLQIKITDAGLRKTTTTEMPSVFRWEFNELRNSLANNGFRALEVFIEIAMNSTLNVTPALKTNYLQRIIKHSAEFKYFFAIGNPSITFKNLEPIISNVVDSNIFPKFTEEEVKDLMSKSSPTPDDIKIISAIKKATVHLTIAQATKQLQSNITEEGFTVSVNIFGSSDKVNSGGTAAQEITLLALAENSHKQAMMQLKIAQSLLKKLASTILYPNYFSLITTTEATTEIYLSNDAGIFI